MSLNKVLLIGRVGINPETHMGNDWQVTNFTLATNEKYTNKSGEKIEDTEWHNIVLKNKLSELADKYVKKGDQLYLEGKIKTRYWETKEGEKRYTTEIVCNIMRFLGGSNKTEQDNDTPF